VALRTLHSLVVILQSTNEDKSQTEMLHALGIGKQNVTCWE